MDFKLTDDKIQLSGVLGYSTVDALHEVFKQVLGRDDTILTVDVGQVERIDTANLQLFLTLHREARAVGKRINWQNISENLARQLRLIGVESLFERAAE